MRERLGRTVTPLFVLVLGAYAYFYQAGGWNQNARFDLVRAIGEHGTLAIDAYAQNTGDKAGREGHFYSDKAPGVSLMAAPVYAVLSAGAGHLRETDRFQAWASYLCTLWAVSLPSAVGVVMLYLLCGVLGLQPPVAAAVALAYALGTLAFPYSTLLYGHQSAAAFAFIAFVLLAQARHQGSPPTRERLVTAGFALGWAVVIEYPAALSLAVIGVYALAWVRPRSRLAWMALGALAALAILFTYHDLALGGPFTLPYRFSIQQPRHRGFFMGLGIPSGRTLYYILFDEYRGLFYGSPWLLLAAPGAWLLLADRRFRAEGGVCVAVALLYLGLNAALSDWHGGWGMGPRHLVAALPFLAVAVAGIGVGAQRVIMMAGRLAAISTWTWTAVRAAGTLAIGYSMFLMLAGTAVKPEVPRDVYQPYQQFLLPAFLEGRLALNTQSIDMPTGRGRSVRFAWNLGQQLGLAGGASLLPLGLYAALTGGWLLVALRREARRPL